MEGKQTKLAELLRPVSPVAGPARLVNPIRSTHRFGDYQPPAARSLMREARVERNRVANGRVQGLIERLRRSVPRPPVVDQTWARFRERWVDFALAGGLIVVALLAAYLILVRR